MEIQSERAKEIDSYIANNKPQVGEWPIEIDGDVSRQLFYRLPIALLRYNVNNGRLAMEVRDWEIKNGIKLDANDPDDVKNIQHLLLSLDETNTELLMIDLRQKRQIEPGVITHDGIVINGNRRMAILQLLHEEEPSGKWTTLDVIRLPPTISEKSLWKIEAGLQLSKDKIAEYHPVNELLKIKEGTQSGLTPNEIAAAMYGRTVDEVKQAIKRLEIIEEFLEFFDPKHPTNYGLIKTFQLHEYFIDIQKAILAPAERKELSNREKRTLQVGAFALLRAGILAQSSTLKKKKKSVTHWDVRELGKIYADNDAKAEFLNHIQPLIKDPKKITCLPPETILEDFQAASDVLENKADIDKPALLIEKALKALKSIDMNSKHLFEDRTKSAFEELKNVVERLSATLS
jgi:hypothetical protein